MYKYNFNVEVVELWRLGKKRCFKPNSERGGAVLQEVRHAEGAEHAEAGADGAFELAQVQVVRQRGGAGEPLKAVPRRRRLHAN